MQTEAPVGVLWTGGPLSWLERLSLVSFRDAGHPVTLFSAVPVEAPEGVTLAAAAEIAPDAAAFRAAFLGARPGWILSDIEMVALGPLRPHEGRLFGWETERLILDGLIALPEGHPAAAAHGPALTEALTEAGELSHARPLGALAPIPFGDRAQLLARGTEGEERLKGAEALRLWSRRLGPKIVEDGGYPRYWSLIGKLLRKHRINPRTHPIEGAPPPPDDVWVEKPRPALKIRAPRPTYRKGAAKPAGKVLIVTTMKNEGPFLLEWIAYHRSIGITDFLVYTNDCTDGTDEFHDLLAAKGIIAEHLDNPFKTMEGVKPQHAALADGQTRPVAQEADWVIGMDVDEYINIHVGDGTFQDLLDTVPDANMISMPWRLYGNGFVRDFEDRFITEQFHWCAPKYCRKPHQAWGFKTAFRQDGIYRKYGVHRPVGLKPTEEERINWVSGSGMPMPKSYHRNGWRMSKLTWGYDLVSLNHYSLRSSESFLVKRDRGRVNHVDRDQGLAYWFRMNHNAEEDRSIADKLPRARAEFDRLMADPEIRAMHQRCVAAHRAKIEELKARPAYAELLDEIESPRLRGLSRILHNFGNAVFLEGPGAVPEEFVREAMALEMADA